MGLLPPSLKFHETGANCGKEVHSEAQLVLWARMNDLGDDGEEGEEGEDGKRRKRGMRDSVGAPSGVALWVGGSQWSYKNH